MLAFIHIPKSAGTSIVNWIVKNTNNKLLILERDWFSHTATHDEMEGVNITFGHFSYDTAKYLKYDSLAFFMRDPLTRVVSQVADWQYKQINAIESDQASRYRKVIDPALPFETNLLSLLESPHELERTLDISNTATYQLGGHVYERSIDIDAAISQSIHNIECAEFVGIYERMPESLHHLAHILNLGSSQEIEVRNKGRVDTENLTKSLSQKAINSIKRHNEADIFIYEHALNLAQKKSKEIRYFDFSPMKADITNNHVAQVTTNVLDTHEVSERCTFSQRFLQILRDIYNWNSNRVNSRDIAIINGSSEREYKFYRTLAKPSNVAMFREDEKTSLASAYEPLLNPMFGTLIPFLPDDFHTKFQFVVVTESWDPASLKKIIEKIAAEETIIVLGQTIKATKPINATVLSELLSDDGFNYVPAALIDGNLYLTPRRIKSSIQDIVRAKLNDLEILRGNLHGHTCLVALTDY